MFGARKGSDFKRPRQNTKVEARPTTTAGATDDLGKGLSGLKIDECGIYAEDRVKESKYLGSKTKNGVQTIMIAPPGSGPGDEPLTFIADSVIGKGSFGVVYQAKLAGDETKLAIKKVMQDKRYKNRELQVMRLLRHPNVVGLKHYFYSTNNSKEVFLNMILEYVPITLFQAAKNYHDRQELFPTPVLKLYMFQVMRGLANLHSGNICHRDIKPQNILVDEKTGECKLCDFGSAKLLAKGEPNIAYICSRYYRAPELVFGATLYTTAIDIWSVGCVMAELLLGHPLFAGESGVDQLVEIIKILGTPTKEEIKSMNPNYTEMKFPQIKGCSLEKVFAVRTTPDAVDLMKRLLTYSPKDRITAAEAMTHPYFNDLQDKTMGIELPLGMAMPNIYNWIPGELESFPERERKVLKRLNSL